MLPQSANAHRLLRRWIETPPSPDFPVAAAKELLERVDEGRQRRVTAFHGHGRHFFTAFKLLIEELLFIGSPVQSNRVIFIYESGHANDFLLVGNVLLDFFECFLVVLG